MAKRYRVTLSDTERERLDDLTRKGTPSVRMVRRAQTLLLAAEEERDEDIAKALRIGVATVEWTRRRFVEEGLEASRPLGRSPCATASASGLRGAAGRPGGR